MLSQLEMQFKKQGYVSLSVSFRGVNTKWEGGLEICHVFTNTIVFK